MTFEEACRRVRVGVGSGIGTLGEKTVHATLKLWLDEDTSHHEVPLTDGHVADIYDGVRVTEIQTAGFSGFRKKLAALLEQGPVTVVHPLVRDKWIRWIDPQDGTATEPRRSNRRGSVTDAGCELIYILPLLTHPNLTVTVVMLDVEEHRLLDGWGNDGKRGSHRADRLPLALGDVVTMRCAAEYAALLPPTVTFPCTAAAFGKAARLQGRKLQGTMKVLCSLGVLTREKQGRGYRYDRGRMPD